MVNLIRTMETPPAAAATAASSPASSNASPASGSASPSGLRRFVLNLPPGFHFLPTGAELVVHFLRRRFAGHPLPLPIIVEERILDFHPEELVEKYRMYGEDRWFFFTTRERKHEIGSRPNRTTADNGHWNATGSKRPIYSGGALVGCVGTLVYYEESRKKINEDEASPPPPPPPEEEDGGPELPEEENAGLAPKGVKTDWTMYEYESLTSKAEFEARLNGNGKIDQLVLCTIQKKKHCEESQTTTKKKKKNKKEKGQCKKGKEEEKGNRVVGKKRKRKELVEEQEEYLKRTLMAKAPQQQAPAALGEDDGNSDVDTDMSLHTTNTSPLPAPSQEMMMVPAGGDNLNVYPHNMMHQNFNQPMKSLQAPAPEGFCPYQHPNCYTQHMQLNTMAPPQVYCSRGFGPGISDFGYSNNNYLHRTNMDHGHLSSILFPPRPSYGFGGSTGRMFTPSAGCNAPSLPPSKL